MIWRNLNASNSTIYSVFREPSKELAEPLGSAEPRLKTTALINSHPLYANSLHASLFLESLSLA